jgi:hypothetical protein
MDTGLAAARKQWLKNGFDPAFYPQLRTSLAFQRKLLKALFDGGVGQLI